MRSLLIVFLLCLALLLWAASAIARAVRRHGEAETRASAEKPKELEDL